MWVSKRKFDNLTTRVTDLEGYIAQLQCDTQLWIPDKEIPQYRIISIGNFRQRDNILLTDVIKKLIEYLGIKIERPEQLIQEQFVFKKEKSK
jgi:hypothetical protein